jgi:acyl-coenzyme A thioesterase PaaI-like protein
MREEIGFILAAVVCIGLTAVPASAQTTVQKVGTLGGPYIFAPLNSADAAAANACVTGKGTPVEHNGAKYCRTDKTSPGTTLPRK